MKRLIYILLPLLLVCCKKADTTINPTMSMALVKASSTGCTLSVRMGEGTDHYRMALLSESEFSPAAADLALAASAIYRNEKRTFERLWGEKNYVVCAAPVGSNGVRGKTQYLAVTLTAMDLEVLLYTPGSATTELNKYNTLNMMAFSNGIAGAVRCALSTNEAWELLKAQKGLKEAADEVLESSHIEFTRQMLEELADTDKLKRDILYFNPLEPGTKYTLVVWLETLDGESRYYTFDGKTEPEPEPES